MRVLFLMVYFPENGSTLYTDLAEEFRDKGHDVYVATIIEKAKTEEYDIVGLSSLMTTSQPYMKEVVERRDGFGLKDKFHIIVGGAPITESYANNIGADAFGQDAVEAIEKCMQLIDKKNTNTRS